MSNDSLLWLGTDDGLCVFNLSISRGRWFFPKEKYRPAINSIITEKNGLWVGTDRGFYFCNLQTKTIEKTDTVTKTTKKIKREFLNWQMITTHYYLDNRKILCAVSLDSMLWIGTQNGLVSLRKNNWKAKILGGTGTPVNGPIHSICKTDSCLWLATDFGAVQVDPQCKKWNVYTKDDGLIDNQVLVLEKQDKYIWLGTNNGVTRCRWINVQRQRAF